MSVEFLVAFHVPEFPFLGVRCFVAVDNPKDFSTGAFRKTPVARNEVM